MKIQKLNKEKVKEKNEAGYKDNDSKIGKTGSTTENNEKTNTQNEEQDGKQIEKGKDGERKNIEKEQERNNKERQNSESETCKRCKEYVETGVYCEKCNSWYHYEREDTTKKQVMKMYPGKTQYICKEDQKIEYEKTWIIKYNQLKKEMEKMKEEKAKVTKTVEEMTKKLEISKKKQTEQDTKYRELQEKNIKNKLNMEQQKQDINKLNQEIKTNEEVIKALRGMQTITVSKATDKEQEIKELWKRLEKEKGITTIMTKENIEMREKIKLMEEKIKVKQKHYEDRGK